MAEPRKRIAELEQRVERMVLAPDEVGGAFGKLVGRVFRLFGWQARFEAVALAALVSDTDVSAGDANDRLEQALDEAEDNIARAERAVIAHRYVPTAHASWLGRVLSVLHHFADSDGTPEATRALGSLDATRVLPPLTIETAALEAQAEGKSKPEVEQQARLLELQLSAIDHIAEAARAETSFLERRRRLLEGARRLLLDARAALPVDAAGAAQRERWLASEITLIDRLEAAGLDPRVALVHQAKHFARRGDRDRLYSALLALDGFALAVGDRAISDRTGRALDQLPGVSVKSGAGAASASESMARSATELFGKKVVSHLSASTSRARDRYAAPGVDPELAKMAQEFLAPGTETASLAALLAVDGCFEVGAALSPVRAREQEEIARLVSHPTAEMLLVQARSVEDVPYAVVEDPRSLLLDLASGRLLARRFVARHTRAVERTRFVGEARVYVLDGSSSMCTDGKQQSRARMRDAILLAELATMMRRLEEPDRSVRLSLYYRYFTLKLGEVCCVRSADEALAAMGDVMGTVREGGTNIQQAIVSSLELIRDAKRADPDLARANIVLVTDGNAPIDADAIRQAREATAGVTIAVSVIALGEENPVLRELAARQRARGERSFYQFIDDERLAELCAGDLRPVHPAPGLTLDDAALRDRIEDTITELVDLEAGRRTHQAGSDESREGQLAALDVEARDEAAVERRYHRWFPRITEQRVDSVPVAGGDAEAIQIVLATIAEIVGELSGSPMRRRADAIELIERLLPDARMTPARYHDVVAREVHFLRDALLSVHAAVGGTDVGFESRLSAATKRSEKR